jgi:hypothetical protein
MLMKLREKQSLGLVNRSVKCKPPLVIRMDNTFFLNSKGDKPILHRLYCLFGWCKQFVNFVIGPVLAILGRFGMRPAKT